MSVGTILFGIPERLLGAFASGQVVRVGTLLKDSGSGRIVGHVQETGWIGSLSGLTSLLSFPVSPIATLSGLAANVQLYRIDQKLDLVDKKLDVVLDVVNGLKTLQLANLAVAGLGIGVTIGGFALMTRRFAALGQQVERQTAAINALAQHIEALDRRLDRVERNQIWMPLRDRSLALESAMKRIEDAPLRNDSGKVIAESGDELQGIADFFLSRIRDEGDNFPKIDSVAWIMEMFYLASSMRIQCYLRTGEERAARDRAERSADELNRIADALSPVALARRAIGNGTATDAEWEATIDTAGRFLRGLREMQARMITRPHLIEAVIDTGLRGPDFLALAEGETKSALLLIPHRP